jgi:two-component system chemotaxis response regulator CheB
MSTSRAFDTDHLTRVLVVDDSAVVRGLIARCLDADPAIEVVSTAAHGELALTELRRNPADVVVLDIEMPVMDGLTALSHIVKQFPGVRVIMASALTLRNAEIGMKALQQGASDYVSKPDGGLANAEEFKRELIAKVKALGGRQRPGPAPAPAQVRRPAPVTAAFRPGRVRPTVLAIGASTGGPPALLKLFESLKGAVQQPILLTQHMPPNFTALLAEQLTRISGRACAEARDGEPVRPGQCYVAPGGWHMVVDRDGATPVLRLNQDPPENFCRPAVDPMLRSAARVYGSGVLAAILTGMGADGAKGCEAVAQAGGRFIAQDEATSVVWGMPGATAATGLAEAILPLGEIGPWIRRTTSAAA